MSYHEFRLQQDIENILKGSGPLSLDELIYDVINEGSISSRCYKEDEVRSIVMDLVEVHFIRKNINNTYEWIE